MPSNNPEVNKRARDKWYRNNKEKQIAKQNERREELRRWLWEYKSSLICTDCKKLFIDCPEQCDFHHLDPSQKEGNIGLMIVKSKKSVLNEIVKCIPLCANCHRTRHKDSFLYYNTIQ